MAHLLQAKPDKKVIVWALHIDGRPVHGFNKDGQVLVRLEAGEHRFTYEVRGAGSSLELSLTGEPTPKIIVPEGETFPLTIKVRDDRTVAYDALYVEV